MPRVTARGRSSAWIWLVWRQLLGASAAGPAARLTPAHKGFAAGGEFAPPSCVMHRFPASPLIVCGIALSINAPANTSLLRIVAPPHKMNAVHSDSEAPYMDSVHSTRGARRRGAPPSGQRLTRDAVIARAEQLITRDGLTAFSLRSLAAGLDVRPNALYNHVRSRAELLDSVAERFVSGLRLPPTGKPWPDWVRAVATELRAQLIEYPGLTELVLARAGATTTEIGRAHV